MTISLTKQQFAKAIAESKTHFDPMIKECADNSFIINLPGVGTLGTHRSNDVRHFKSAQAVINILRDMNVQRAIWVLEDDNNED